MDEETREELEGMALRVKSLEGDLYETKNRFRETEWQHAVVKDASLMLACAVEKIQEVLHRD